MCGILGGVTPAYFELQRLRDALETIRHRGPDDSGWFLEAPAFLGNRRLSIIDSSGGQQPIYNEDGTVVVVLNGEIYNFKELRSELQSSGHTFKSLTDTEVLAHGYEQWGHKLVDRLRGMFAFAIWDKRKRELFLARDRFGKKPLYYTVSNEHGILFASEIKALRQLCSDFGASWRVRPQAVYDYLSLLSVPQPSTIFEEVRFLPQGSCGVFSGDKLRIAKFWQLPQPTPKRISYPDAMAQAREQIREAVRFRLRSDVPLGVFLSGGIDSSIIAYEASKEVGANLQTFTVGVDDDVLDESGVAARTAKALGIRNTLIKLDFNPLHTFEKVIPNFDQPFGDPSALPSYAVSRKSREFVTVVLNGDGGDEVFGGYRRYVAARLADTIPFLATLGAVRADKLLLALSVGRRNLAGFAGRLIRGVSQTLGDRYLTWTTDMLSERDKRLVWRGGPVEPTENWIESVLPPGLSELRRSMLGDQNILLPFLLVKMDMASMLASVEARSPFLDHHVAEFAASLPDHFLVRGLRAKALLRDAYRGLLPDEVIRAPKRGFEIPLQRWLETSLRDILNDLLGSPNSKVRDFLDSKFIEQVLAGEILKERNHSYILYALLVLEVWLRNPQPKPSGRPASVHLA